MTIIVSSSGREATLFAALCDQKSWPCHACSTIAEFTKIVESLAPHTVITRQRLADGYSDDVLRLLTSNGQFADTRKIVLLPANATAQQEVRLVGLGADCLMRDPLRLEVLLAHVGHNQARQKATAAARSVPEPIFEIAGVRVHANKHILEKDGCTISVAPQVVALLRLLSRSADKVITYPVIYCELFNRCFTGDTSNARVLLAKTANCFTPLEPNFRSHIRVIAKSGYLYSTVAKKQGPSKGPKRHQPKPR